MSVKISYRLSLLVKLFVQATQMSWIHILFILYVKAHDTFRQESTNASIQKSHAVQELSKLRKNYESLEIESKQVSMRKYSYVKFQYG